MKKNITGTLIILFIIATFFYSCQKPGCTGNAGELTVQERILSAFSNVELSDNIDLILIQGNTEKIEITAPENILPNIQTNITGDVLAISNTTECRWLRNPDERIKVKLYFRDLANFEYKGSGDITNEDTIRGSSLRFNSETGAGNIDLKVNVDILQAIILNENATMIFHGQARYCQTYNNARGILDLSRLKVKSMHIVYSGLADTHINVSDDIEAYVRYRGNVYCKGNPVIIKQEYFSSGRLIVTP